MKKCTKCGKEKSLDEFYKDVRGSSGRRAQCKMCDKKLSAQRRETYRARGPIKVHSKKCPACKYDLPASEYYPKKDSRNGLQGICKSCTKTYHQNQRKKRLTKNPNYEVEYRLKRAFGINLEEYQEMEKSQDYKCAICGTTSPGAHKSRFCVDHDHDTGEIRGLLCDKCNRGIGLLDDDPEKLEVAAAYVRKYKHG